MTIPFETMTSNMTLAYRAMMFARQAHAVQVRKYTGEPYIVHLAEVAGIVATVSYTEVPIAVAWLHDCIEDCNVTEENLLQHFPKVIVENVLMLSDIEQGSRAERKAASRERLSKAEGWVQTIKCADIISNGQSVVLHDPKFAVTYLEEKSLLLDVLTKADRRLVDIARKLVK
jgi:(p)ppGpp synthase/HD superfamily hydrolase